MLKVNKVIKTIIYWDFLFISSWGLLAPFFAIFILQDITLGNVAEGAKVAGLAMLFYWATKGVLQIPIGLYLDRNHGEIDDFWFCFIGVIITGLVPFGFVFSWLPWHIYVLQVIYALAMAMIVPSAGAIFIRHIDKHKEALETSLDSSLINIGAGVAGAIGGIMVGAIGFQFLFILTGVLTIISAFLLFPIRKEMVPKVPRDHYSFLHHRGHTLK